MNKNIIDISWNFRGELIRSFSTNVNETAAVNNIINENGFNNTQKLNILNCYNDKRSVFPISNLKNMNTTTKKFFIILNYLLMRRFP